MNYKPSGVMLFRSLGRLVVDIHNHEFCVNPLANVGLVGILREKRRFKKSLSYSIGI